MMRCLLALCFVLLACKAEPPAPVEPVWGKQPCAHCMMLLSERRPAAQLLLPDGARQFFDDVGCMAEWLTRGGERPTAAWVRRVDDSDWQDAFSTRYSSGHRTPMDYGFLSADEGLTFPQLQAAVEQKTKSRLEAR